MASFKRVLFLDIDGVLNSYAVAGYRLDGYRGPHRRWIKDLSPLLVNRLNRLMDAHPDVAIVLSSTWRKKHTPEQMSELLQHRGFRYEVVDRTPWVYSEVYESGILDQRYGFRDTLPRAWFIKLWLQRHPEVESFVILDDEGPDSFLDLTGRLVRTKVGFKRRDDMLREHQVDKAIQMLDAPFPIYGPPRISRQGEWVENGIHYYGDVWGDPVTKTPKTYQVFEWQAHNGWKPLDEAPGEFVMTLFRTRLHVCQVKGDRIWPVRVPTAMAKIKRGRDHWVRGPWS